MSSIFDSQEGESVAAAPEVLGKGYGAYEVAYQMISYLLEKTYRRIDKKQAFRETLNGYMKAKTKGHIKEVESMHFFACKADHSPIPDDKIEPAPLGSDCLLPTAAGIDRENTYKKQLMEMLSQKGKQGGVVKKKEERKEEKERYQKLNIGDSDDEDGFTKQLRKMKEERTLKILKQKKAQQFQAQRLREEQKQVRGKKKMPQQKVNYDYSGSMLKIKTQKRSNLVGKGTKTNSNGKLIVNKEAIDDPNPTTLEGQFKGKKQVSPSSNFSKKPIVYFSQNRSISEGVEVVPGIRFGSDGKAIEAKVKIIPTSELKKKLGKKMLNKQEFQRIKVLNTVGTQMIRESSLPILTQKSSNQKDKRSKRPLYGSSIIQDKSTIVVESQPLRLKLIEKLQEYKQQPDQDSRQNMRDQGQEEVALGRIDSFNMNYLRTKGQGSSKGSRESTLASSIISLPRLKHHSSLHSVHSLPKERQKVKELPLILTERRRTYDEKLRE